jgi:hypothetical protein
MLVGVDGGGAMRVRLGATAMLVLLVLTGCSHAATDNNSSGSNNGNPSSVSTETQPPGAEARAGSPAPGAPGGAAAATMPDPCVLITKADVTKVIGEPDSTAIAPGTQPGQRSCGYANTASGKLVTVAVFPTDQAGFDKLKTNAGTTITNVPGVGDSAFSAASAMYARKGTVAVSVYVAGLTPDSAVTTALSSLVQTALGRM